MPKLLIRRTAVILALAVSPVGLAGCDILDIDKAAKSLGLKLDENVDKLIRELRVAEKESELWRAEVAKLREEFRAMPERIVFESDEEFKRMVDFTLTRINQERLQDVIELTGLLKEKKFLPALDLYRRARKQYESRYVPKADGALPSRVEVTWADAQTPVVRDRVHTIKISGYDLLQPENRYKLELTDADGKVTRDVTRYLIPYTNYRFQVDISPGQGLRFQEGDARLAFSWDGRRLITIPVTWDQRPDPTKVLNFGNVVGGRVTVSERAAALLQFGLIDRSTVEAGATAARAIIVTDRIEGGSHATFSAPGGTVRFHSKIDGPGTSVQVFAPGGEFEAVETSGFLKEGSKFDSNGSAYIVARRVVLNGVLNGNATLYVRLTKGGELHVHEMDGNARLFIEKDDPSDPNPIVAIRQQKGNAKVFDHREVFQKEWAICAKCLAVYFKAAGPGKCAAGAVHEPQAGGDLGLMHDVPSPYAQSDWRYCQKCRAIFHRSQPGGDVCPCGGGHDGSGSFDYDVRYDPQPIQGVRYGRFCDRCGEMIAPGGASLGVCPAKGSHTLGPTLYRLSTHSAN